jgi:hypothetical protein
MGLVETGIGIVHVYDDRATLTYPVFAGVRQAARVFILLLSTARHD